MIKLQNIQSLTSFKRNTSESVKRLKKNKSPLVLTVNGKAELVVLDANEFEQILEQMERAEIIAGIRRGLDDVANNRMMSSDEFEDNEYDS